MEQKDTAFLQRRSFISSLLKAGGAASLLSVPSIGLTVSRFQSLRTYSVQDVIDIIVKEIPGAPFHQTVDTIKAGQADQQVKGIVTTMFPTVEVIEKTASSGANFIIAHEPSFYNHTDDPNWVQNNEILRQKQALLAKYQIAIWRFHDYWHSFKPDGIRYGFLKSTGWLPYQKPGTFLVEIPPVPLRSLIDHLKISLQTGHLRMIGDPDQVCSRLALIPGAAGGQIQIAVAEKEQPDVLIVGEVHEWETAEYIRDARLLGAKTALVILGHSVSEEPGMQWLVEWLQPKLPELKILHISSGDPFTWM
jgi:putative NIF3 family GTP cyclohydrolase 1 type 2